MINNVSIKYYPEHINQKIFKDLFFEYISLRLNSILNSKINMIEISISKNTSGIKYFENDKHISSDSFHSSYFLQFLKDTNIEHMLLNSHQNMEKLQNKIKEIKKSNKGRQNETNYEH